MARREDYEHWGMGLPITSEALQDVDAVCEELGLQRGEVCRLIVITWSKARRGKVQELWGFAPGVVFAASTNGQGDIPALLGGTAHTEPVAMPPTQRRKKVVSETAAAAVQGLDLD
jgi:hypothetical protein